MLIYGIISPHPPILLPEIGREQTNQVQATTDALEQAAQQLAQARPERLIIIAPHEGHGFAVPMHFLGRHLPPDLPIEQILVTESSYQRYYELGQATGHQLAGESRRTAIIASGDLSHVLKADGPYGYNAAGPKLDEQIVQAIRRADAGALLAIDPATLENGAECGLRSILFLLGAVEETGAQPKVLAYEGPFGVGYLTATFAPALSTRETSAPMREARS